MTITSTNNWLINLTIQFKEETKMKNQALENMKQEVASELGVPLKQGYNGDLTAKQAGSVGGEMVKRMIQAQTNQMNGNK